VAPIDPTAARFPSVPAKAGHYESFYLKLCHPSEPLGAWIRYTVHKRPGAAPTGSLWFTLFEAGGPRAAKLTLPGPDSGVGDWLRVGEARIGPDGARGSIGAEVVWELRIEEREPPLLHLPRPWMYGAPLPRTKLASLAPSAFFSGGLSVDGRELPVDGWRGMVGHNWGSEHAERWVWLHGVGFAEAPGAWLDVAIGRVRVGRVLTPWIANGALGLDGRRYALGGLRRRVAVDARPGTLSARLPGSGVVVSVSADAPDGQTVAFRYADPGGGEHVAMNCSIAELRLRVERPGRPALELATAHGGAYELGVRAVPPGVSVEPFPDP
jgi:hypothetical protein